MKTRFPQINLAACLLPWRENYSLDEAAFRRHIQTTIREGYQHIYLMGTAGEGYALTDRQFEGVVTVFAQEMHGPDLQPMVGVISLSMGEIIDRLRFAHQLGIRHFQISLPSWGALTDDEVMTFFSGVCGEFPDSKFLHYNLPRVKRVLTGLDYRRVADAVPNLMATKNSTWDYARVADLMTHAPDLQHVFVESSFAFGCLFGECSLLCSFDSLFPKLTHKFFAAGTARDIPALMEMHQVLNRIGHVLFDHITEAHIDGAYDKLLVWLRDPSFPLRLLPPYNGLSSKEARTARLAFEAEFVSLA